MPPTKKKQQSSNNTQGNQNTSQSQQVSFSIPWLNPSPIVPPSTSNQTQDINQIDANWQPPLPYPSPSSPNTSVATSTQNIPSQPTGGNNLNQSILQDIGANFPNLPISDDPQLMNMFESMMRLGMNPRFSMGENTAFSVSMPYNDPTTLEYFNWAKDTYNSIKQGYDDYYNQMIKYIDEENKRRDTYNRIISNEIIPENPYKEDLSKVSQIMGGLTDYTHTPFGVNPLYPGTYQLKYQKLPPKEYKPDLPQIPIYRPSGISYSRSVGERMSLGGGAGTQRQPKATEQLPVAIVNYKEQKIDNKGWSGHADEPNLAELNKSQDIFTHPAIGKQITSNLNQVFADGQGHFLDRLLKLKNYDITYKNDKDLTAESIKENVYPKTLIQSIASWILAAREGKIEEKLPSDIPGILKDYILPYKFGKYNANLTPYVYANERNLFEYNTTPEGGVATMLKAGDYGKMIRALEIVIDKYLDQRVEGDKTLYENLTDHVIKNSDIPRKFGRDPNASDQESINRFRRLFRTWLLHNLTVKMAGEILHGQ